MCRYHVEFSFIFLTYWKKKSLNVSSTFVDSRKILSRSHFKMELGEPFISAEKCALDLGMGSPLGVVAAGMQNQSGILPSFTWPCLEMWML